MSKLDKRVFCSEHILRLNPVLNPGEFLVLYRVATSYLPEVTTIRVGIGELDYLEVLRRSNNVNIIAVFDEKLNQRPIGGE